MREGVERFPAFTSIGMTDPLRSNEEFNLMHTVRLVVIQGVTPLEHQDHLLLAQLTLCIKFKYQTSEIGIKFKFAIFR